MHMVPQSTDAVRRISTPQFCLIAFGLFSVIKYSETLVRFNFRNVSYINEISINNFATNFEYQ